VATLIDRERFGRELARRFVLRGHMMLLLLAVVLSGVVASKLLLLLGLGAMRIRYALAVIAAYLVFIGLVGLWLMYVRRVMFVAARTSSEHGSSSSSLSGFDFGSSGSGSGVDVPRFSSGGGSFGGGGASGSFADADVVSPSNVTASSVSGSSSGSGSGSSWGGFDLDDGIWIVIVFIVFVAVLAVAGGWVIYDAPHMFSEAAFQFFLASGLLRGTRALKAGGWAAVAAGGWKGIVVRRTVIPFLIVAIAAAAFGHIAQKLCPEARSVVDAFRFCVSPS
jgi:hypothetical protein